jgi:hypothetical protein
MIMRAAKEAKRIRSNAITSARRRRLKAAIAEAAVRDETESNKITTAAMRKKRMAEKQKIQKEQNDTEEEKDGVVKRRTVAKQKQNVQIEKKDTEKEKATFALKAKQNVEKKKNDAEEGKDSSDDGEIKEESIVDAQKTKQSVTASCTVPLNLPTSSTAVSTIATASVVAAPGTCHLPYSF